MTNTFINALLFSLALSLDSLVAFFGYGMENIKVPFKRLILIITLNTFVLACGLLLGFLLTGAINTSFEKYLSFALLLITGLCKLFSSLLKIWLNRKSNDKSPIKIKFLDYNLFLSVCLDPVKADLNKDKILSLKESFLIGTILSLDSLGVGIGLGISDSFPYLIIIFSFIIGLIFSFLGNLLGKKISKLTKINFSWLSGLILIILAIVKLVS